VTQPQYTEPTITLTPLNDTAKTLASEPLVIPPTDAKVEVVAGKPRLTYSFQVSGADADRKLATAMVGRRDLKSSIWELASDGNKWRVTPISINAERMDKPWIHSRTIDFQVVLTKEENEQRWKDIDERIRQRRINRKLGT